MTKDEKLQYIDLCYEEGLTTDSMKRIHDFCQDAHSEVRMRVTELLGEFPSVETEELLLTMLKDTNYLVRATACDVLSFSKSLNTLQCLMRFSQDKRTLVRGYAIMSIANIQKNVSTEVEETAKYIEDLLQAEKSQWVKIAIYKSLLFLGKTVYKDFLLRQIENKHYRLRCFALSVLDEALENSVLEMTLVLKQFLEERYFLDNSYAVKDKLLRILNKYTI